MGTIAVQRVLFLHAFEAVRRSSLLKRIAGLNTLTWKSRFILQRLSINGVEEISTYASSDKLLPVQNIRPLTVYDSPFCSAIFVTL